VKKAYVTVGISASGKSTWAREKAKETDAQIIERDCIRKAMMIKAGISHDLDWSQWRYDWERDVTKTWEGLLDSALQSGRVIIMADTNLNENRRAVLIHTLTEAGFDVEEKVFDIPLQTAIRRDRARGLRSVGQDVIMKQYVQFAQQFKPQYVYTKNYIPTVVLSGVGENPFEGKLVGLKVGKDSRRAQFVSPTSNKEEQRDWLENMLDSGALKAYTVESVIETDPISAVIWKSRGFKNVFHQV
jgi:pseT 3'phosphatase, 5'polynucleotide kinase